MILAFHFLRRMAVPMRVWRPVVLSAVVCGLAALGAAQPPAASVVYTEAREHSVRQMVELPGTVEARTAALVASEVDGLVEALRGREGQTVRQGQCSSVCAPRTSS